MFFLTITPIQERRYYMEILTLTGAIVSLLVGVCAIFYFIFRVAKRLEGVIGVDDKGRSLSERLNRVEHQLWENGGDSLADRVNDIEACSRGTSIEVKFIKELLIEHVASSPKKPESR
jgi:hypothetical protein